MALSDKNIVITPNTGQSADPKIVFSGADASTTAQNITLTTYPQNGGTISLDGSVGQLFSVSNSMTGTIYAVADISGLPSIEVLDSGVVKMAQYGGNVLLGTGTDRGAKLQISGTSQAEAPTLGSTSGAALFVGNSDPKYGIVMGVGGSSGKGWIQAQRIDGTATAYDLSLQPIGGIVTIGGNTALHGGNYQSFAVSTQYNTSLNTDSRNARGVTRLYRTDSDSDYSVQTYWTGSYWILKGYTGDTYHGGCQVAYADSAGSATSAGYITGPAATNGTDGWFRSSGATGWYNASYAVGVFSQGAGLVETYNSSSFKANGNLYATGGIYSSYSDGRLKENVRQITGALGIVLAMRGVYYSPNNLAVELGQSQDRSEQVGVISQEVAIVAPEVVVPAPFDRGITEEGVPYSKSGEDYQTVMYERIAPYLIEAIRDQQLIIDSQQAQIDALRAVVEKLIP